jgi:hypothetical protein
MPILAYVLIAVLIGVVTFGCVRSYKPRSETAGESKGPAAFASPLTNHVTRAAIALRLQRLADSTPRPASRVFATCYIMALPPETAEYICPTCGAKTLYAISKASGKLTADEKASIIAAVDQEIPSCREGIKEIHGLEVSLHEKSFCSKCSPGVVRPTLGLMIRYPEQNYSHATWGIDSYDLRLIAEFLSGKDRIGDEDEDLLKDHLPRLRELLGVK